MFSYQGSCRSFQATAYIDYHSALLLSRTFFHSLSTFFSSACHFSDDLLPSPGRSASASPVSRLSEVFLRHQRQVLSYHHRKELSTFFLFFIYFRQFTHFNVSAAKNCDQRCPIIVHSVFLKTASPFCIFFFFHTTLRILNMPHRRKDSIIYSNMTYCCHVSGAIIIVILQTKEPL